MSTPLELWEQYTPYAKAQAYRRSYSYSADVREDFEQAALLGLWRAAITWREGIAPFAIWCRRHVHGELQLEAWRQSFFGAWASRKSYEEAKPLPAVQALPEIPLELELERDEGSEWAEQLIDYLISRLPSQRFRCFARHRWLEGLSLTSIAHQFGLSRSRVEALQVDAMRLLKQYAREFQKEDLSDVA